MRGDKLPLGRSSCVLPWPPLWSNTFLLISCYSLHSCLLITAAIVKNNNAVGDEQLRCDRKQNCPSWLWRRSSDWCEKRKRRRRVGCPTLTGGNLLIRFISGIKNTEECFHCSFFNELYAHKSRKICATCASVCACLCDLQLDLNDPFL